jgi:hypothetical protein
MNKDIQYYDNMIQLHDNHTFWKLNNNTINENNNKNVDLFLYNKLLPKYFEMFKEKMGVELFALGRSGRHICVEDNDYNRRHYKSFKNYVLKLEKMFIDEFNAIDFNKNDVVTKINASNLLEYHTDNYTFRVQDYHYTKKIDGNIEIYNQNGDLTIIPLEDLEYILNDINKINKEL